jgi:hypothetical protein
VAHVVHSLTWCAVERSAGSGEWGEGRARLRDGGRDARDGAFQVVLRHGICHLAGRQRTDLLGRLACDFAAHAAHARVATHIGHVVAAAPPAHARIIPTPQARPHRPVRVEAHGGGRDVRTITATGTRAGSRLGVTAHEGRTPPTHLYPAVRSARSSHRMSSATSTLCLRPAVPSVVQRRAHVSPERRDAASGAASELTRPMRSERRHQRSFRMRPALWALSI